MNKSRIELEAWASRILQAVSIGQYQEDDFVEFKSEWPADCGKAARTIAALANASMGADTMLIIGVDTRQKPPFVAFQQVDPVNWIPQVKSAFYGNHSPDLLTFQVSIGNNTCFVIAIDSTERPFLVKNPNFGSAGQRIENELPWRDGTTTRTARRNEILSLLYSPERATLDIELVHAKAIPLMLEGRESVASRLYFDLYAVPRGSAPIFIPIHRIKWTLKYKDTTTTGGGASMIHSYPRYERNPVGSGYIMPGPMTKFPLQEERDEVMENGESSIIIRSPTFFRHSIDWNMDSQEFEANTFITGTLEYRVGADRIAISVPFVIRTWKGTLVDPAESKRWLA